MFQDISVDELRELQKKKPLAIVDVRSPSEFAESNIPGSVNIPIFTDEERAEIGTVYKQINPDAAMEKGLEIVSAKLPNFIKEFANLPEEEKVVYCWRGGMRSKTSATLIDLMGINAKRLIGGIRGFRTWVVENLEELENNFKPKALVINGYTGSGKTKILNDLQEKGYPVMDLEGMANHRGSVFGMIGKNPHNQKVFDLMFVERALELKDSPYVLLEAESKRVGRATLPDFLLNIKEQGYHIFVDLPMEERVLNILEDYRPWEFPKECMSAFQRIKRRIHTPIAAQIEKDLETGDYNSAVKLLLEYYYDPRYHYTAEQIAEDRSTVLHVKNVEEATRMIEEFIAEKITKAPTN
ncbi:tRNA 2-selenouridine(34) synthase MnmH [Bacillus timonensis]|uniref:tRNA 2-selenouridine(34) synthase MnmH n=1 Tax=Bacillus timonensis TaxID=1033734 RepID=A0A4S3PU60_9BACI|nr:tRNA 2-selenouridine(34) synthase MnmH [Bacillus timonensis]THE13289.1 tRNA 2-selenouridine(34) synthase MnmH [Bacillus timonensis]